METENLKTYDLVRVIELIASANARMPEKYIEIKAPLEMALIAASKELVNSLENKNGE